MLDEELIADVVQIEGYGGDTIPAYRARPLADGAHGGVIVIHHMPGWDSATKEITRRFAAQGYVAICPNLHHREAPGAAPDDAAAAARAAGGVPDERLVADVEGALLHLRAHPECNGRVGVIGYCSGGRQSFLAACSLRLDAAVDCYGGFVVESPPPGAPLHVRPVLDRAPSLSCPLLGLFGAEDTHPSPEHVQMLQAELQRLGKEREFHVMPDAGHGFFAVDRPSYRVAAANTGWTLVFDWFRRHLAA